MIEKPIDVGTVSNENLRLVYENDNIIFDVQVPQRLEKFRGMYSYEKLPMGFKVIFESLKELFGFLSFQSEQKIRVENRMVVILINILGKIKQFELPLEEIQLTGQMRLRSQMKKLQIKLNEKTKQLLGLQQQVQQRQSALEKCRSTVSQLSMAVRQKQSENLKLLNKIRHLQSNIEDLLNEKPKSQNLQQSRLTQQYTPVKKNYFGTKSKKAKQLEEYGRKISFKIDENAKHYIKFWTSLNEVEKLHGPTYQLFHNEAIPKEGKYYFDIKIILIKNNNIVVGVITDKNKDEQFSFKKMNCVCYNGYDGSICEQDKQRYVAIKPKEGNKLRTVIDMTLSQIEWFIMGGEGKTAIGRAVIPASMIKQSIYPYFELYWEGNKIKLNA